MADDHAVPRGTGSISSWSWVFRPSLWFATASILTAVSHELAHAATAFALGVPSTLFNYSVDFDVPEAETPSAAAITIWAAGPVFSLVTGALGWLAYRRTARSAAGLPLLCLAAFGIATFCGNLMSVSLGGDFANIAVELQVPMDVRYEATAIGLLLLVAVQFWLGDRLAQWIPAHVGRVYGTLGIVVLPVVLGTAVVILVNQPMPASFVTGRVVESSFALFTAIGALAARNRSAPGQSLQLRWIDGLMIVVATAAVRLTIPGIPFLR